MSGDHIPDPDHIARYCGGKQIDENGRIDGAAFRLRRRDGIPEEYLSVNWLEFLATVNRPAQVAALQAVFLSKAFKVGSTARFAVLNVGDLRAYVRDESPDRRELSVLHEPEQDDASHCGLYGLRMDDDLISDLIAGIVHETYSAKAG